MYLLRKTPPLYHLGKRGCRDAIFIDMLPGVTVWVHRCVIMILCWPMPWGTGWVLEDRVGSCDISMTQSLPVLSFGVYQIDLELMDGAVIVSLFGPARRRGWRLSSGVRLMP